MNYDFSQLNDKEFEYIATDLLSAELGVRIERFKPGRDQGVDGRYYSDDSGERVIQCKHYLKTGYKGLLSTLKNTEKPKVIKLKPKEYFVVTSLPLSRNNKKEIKKIFSPFISRDDHIFGQEDLNQILLNHPKIEERYFKLWISSTTVLQRILNNAIKGRSADELERIQNNSQKYAITENHNRALKTLKENRVLIISGEPGIGKTTLAEQLCLSFVALDFEFLEIEESLSEAEDAFIKGKKQIFYFDDFLGSNYLEAIENKKDSHIAKFIGRVENDNKKIFLLTSRTSILNSGILHSPILANKNISKNEYLLTIDKLTRLDKAKILYNHIWFSDLSEAFVEEIYTDKRYKGIIDHSNFNPRLIEFITDVNRIGEVESHAYWEYILDTLENPTEIWENSFKVQNNAFVRYLVCLVAFNGGEIWEDDLSAAYRRVNQIAPIPNTSHTEKDFKSIARLATKSFLNRVNKNGVIRYSLFNPSIQDFVLQEYKKDVGRLSEIYRALASTKSLKQLISLKGEGIIEEGEYNRILEEIFEYSAGKQGDNDFQIYLCNLFHSDQTKHQRIIRILASICDNPGPVNELQSFLQLLRFFEGSLKLDDFVFLRDAISDRYPDESDIICLFEYLEDKEVVDASLIKELQESLEVILVDKVRSDAINFDPEKYCSYFGFDDEPPDFIFDNDAFEKDLLELTENTISDFYSDVKAVEKFGIDISYDLVSSQIDIDEVSEIMLDVWTEGSIDHELYSSEILSGQQVDDIDDLFERT